MRADLAAAMATLDTCEAEHAAASCAQVAAHRAGIAAARAAEDAADAAEFDAFRANATAGAAEHAAADAALDLLTDHESACFFAIANPHRVYGAGRAALIRIAVNMARVGQLRPVA